MHTPMCTKGVLESDLSANARGLRHHVARSSSGLHSCKYAADLRPIESKLNLFDETPVEVGGAIRTETMTEFGIRSVLDVFFYLLP